MTYETKDGSGTCFKNQKKESATHADYNGEAKVGDKLYYLNVWVKKDKNGNDYFSMSFKLKQPAQNKPIKPEGWKNQPDDDF